MAAGHCRSAVRPKISSGLWRVALVAVFAGSFVSWIATPAASVTSTTLPGPAPNQSQINATQSQVSQMEATLTQEEQQTSVLDDRYNTAEQDLQNAQTSLKSIGDNLVRTRSAIEVDKRRVAGDAVLAYIYGTPESGLASMFSSSANQTLARNQYTADIVGDLTKAQNALESSETQLQAQEAQQQTVEAQAQTEAAQAKSLAAANEQEAATTKATLNQVQGQLAQEVAQAAVEEAQQEAAAAAQAANAAAAQKAAAAAAAAATVAAAVGGSSSGATATNAANQAASAAGDPVATGPIGGTSSGSSAQMTAVQAAVSQLGVPYVFGGETPGVGFDCSGLVQWAWSQAGVSIPRTTETEWPALKHVSLDALEPGDLLFYYNLDGDNQVDHVVMYTGSGPYGADTVIQAPFTGATVSYSPIFVEGLIGAARP